MSVCVCVSVSVCLSVTTLCPLTSATSDTHLCRVLTHGFSKNKFRSKVMAWKSQYANKLELTASRYRALS